LAAVVGLEARRIERGLADECLQHIGARDVEVVAEVRSEEPLMEPLEGGFALEFGALGGGQRRYAGGRQPRVDLGRYEARARLLGADALPSLAGLFRDAPVRLLTGDQRESPPVQANAIAVDLSDLAEADRGVV